MPGLQELTLQAAFFVISRRSSSTTRCWFPVSLPTSSSPSDSVAISPPPLAHRLGRPPGTPFRGRPEMDPSCISHDPTHPQLARFAPTRCDSSSHRSTCARLAKSARQAPPSPSLAHKHLPPHGIESSELTPEKSPDEETIQLTRIKSATEMGADMLI